MNVTLTGTGNMGSAFASQLSRAGHKAGVNAHYLEPLASLYIYLGYGAGLGTAITPPWIHK